MKKDYNLLNLAAKTLERINLSEDKIRFETNSLRDGKLTLLLGEREVEYLVKFKEKLTISYSQLLMIEKEKNDLPVMLIADYVNPAMAERFRSNQVEFIDTAGNVFINQPPVYVFIKGNKTEVLKGKNVTRAFKNSGLRIIFGFLTQPKMLNLPYREIGKLAGVALGTVGWVMRDLKQLGFIKHAEKDTLNLQRKEELLQRWVTAYAEKLRPKQILGQYTGGSDFWKKTNNYTDKVKYSGELAATKLTNYLKPQKITVFLKKENLNDFLLENRLKKDENGEIEVLEKFWNFDFKDAKDNLVHPFLVYADLIATGKQRNIETAKILYEKHIDRLIRESRP